jgi:S1-C subfamily serine protease
MNQIARIAPGSRIRIKILRGGETLEIQAEVGQRPLTGDQQSKRG